MQLNFIFPKEDKIHLERDRFLTEKMGDCWHESDSEDVARNVSFIGHTCKKCGNFYFENNDFSSEEDFLKLLNWANEQQSLSPVVSQFEASYFMDEEVGPQARKKFADVLYALLSMVKRTRKNAKRSAA